MVGRSKAVMDGFHVIVVEEKADKGKGLRDPIEYPWALPVSQCSLFIFSCSGGLAPVIAGAGAS
jgi:hypothetical protein